MQKVYELWLDESGEFREEQKKQQDHFKPSLIGGFLIEQERVGEIDAAGLVDAAKNHANHLSNSDKRNYVLPVLEKMYREYGARQVFFENAEYEDGVTNRQLYLRVMAEGLMQLMLTLNARHESVRLKVLIAQRQDPDMTGAARRIAETEYLTALKKCIARKKKEHKVYLDEESILSFEIRRAADDSRLQLADFACNTRLTRDSGAFVDVRNRVAALHDSGYIFALTEMGSQNYIKQSLVQSHFADAIIELYTTYDHLEREKELEIIIARMKEADYQVVKTEMRHCAAELLTFAAREEDYETEEAVLNALRQELIPLLRENGLSHRHLYYTVLNQLADKYLREGDIVMAQQLVQECSLVQRELGVSLEEVLSFYQLAEKKARLAIASYDADTAEKLMEEVCESLHRMMKGIIADPVFGGRFPRVKSEYYGEALGIWLQALLRMQQEQPEVYEKAVRLSELALQQYKNTEGELEFQRQYRCRLEYIQGNYEEALLWLLQSKMYVVDEVSERSIRSTLADVSGRTGESSGMYFLMHYLTIMTAAQRAENPLGDVMYRLLREEKLLLREAGLSGEESRQYYDNPVDMDEVKPVETGIHYHPGEIIMWKYAGYLYACKKYKEALPFYDKAVKMCFRFENYQTMMITGIGIAAERICCQEKLWNYAGVKKEYKELCEVVRRILQQNLNASTRAYVMSLQQLLEEARDKDGNIKTERLRKLAERIVY